MEHSVAVENMARLSKIGFDTRMTSLPCMIEESEEFSASHKAFTIDQRAKLGVPHQE